MSAEFAGGASPQAPDLTPSRRSENLALTFQEMFTVIARLRSNRQAVTNAGSFRANMLGVLKRVEQEAQALGYGADDVRVAAFAIVAFLDESVLNSRNPVFADWPRQPLQVQIFGSGVAGEIFFQNLQKLLGQKDSSPLADVLEVYYLCLLLGYRGRYSLSGGEGLRSVMDAVAEKIARTRGSGPLLANAWLGTAAPIRARSSDVWVRRLFYVALACLVLASALFLVFKVSLGQGISELRQISLQNAP